MAKPICIEALDRRVLLATTPATYVPPTNPRTVVDLDAGWKFIRSNPSGASGSSYNDSNWSNVSLPHTWNNFDGQDGGSNYFRGSTWYRRHYKVPSSMTNKRIFLKFDGSNISTDLYVNGKMVGSHKGGFAAFTFDVTTFVKINSDNVIAVKVNNQSDAAVAPLSGDFNQDGGLYRDVSLIATNKAHVHLLDASAPAVYLTPSSISSKSATLSVKTKLRNDNSSTTKKLTIESTVVDAAGKVVVKTSSTKTMSPKTSATQTQTLQITNPHLWNGLKDPYLYKVYVAIKDGSGVIDYLSQPLGIRTFKVDPNKGFMLNGQPYDLHGVAFHQDRKNKGFAVSDADRAQDVNLVKEIGATFVRLAHYQHDQQTYDLLDKAGLIAWSEIPLVNGINSGDSFANNAKQQLTELIRQNYNHASVVVWGLFNEISQNSKADTLIPQLQSLAKTEDPTRLTTGATYIQIADNAKLNTRTDTIATNRYYGWYDGVADDLGVWADSFHAKYPTRPMGISEYGAGGSINHHELRPADIDTEGEWHPEEYQSLIHEQSWPQLEARDYLWCKTIWNMFDFASDLRAEGDAPGINDKGLVTYDRQTKKDAFYYYKANWSAEKFVYITSRRWTDRTDALTDVKVYSNCDEVELFVNGQSQGTRAVSNHVFVWNDIELAEGENTITAVPVGEDTVTQDEVSWTLTSPAQPVAPGAKGISQFSRAVQSRVFEELIDGQGKEE